MTKAELYEQLQRAIMLIEDGSPHHAKRLLEELRTMIHLREIMLEVTIITVYFLEII